MFYESFESPELFDASLAFARAQELLLWASPEQRTFAARESGGGGLQCSTVRSSPQRRAHAPVLVPFLQPSGAPTHVPAQVPASKCVVKTNSLRCKPLPCAGHVHIRDFIKAAKAAQAQGKPIPQAAAAGGVTAQA